MEYNIAITMSAQNLDNIKKNPNSFISNIEKCLKGRKEQGISSFTLKDSNSFVCIQPEKNKDINHLLFSNGFKIISLKDKENASFDISNLIEYQDRIIEAKEEILKSQNMIKDILCDKIIEKHFSGDKEKCKNMNIEDIAPLFVTNDWWQKVQNEYHSKSFWEEEFSSINLATYLLKEY